jgi:hypothetical protein
LKKLAFLGGAAGLGLIALLHSPTTQAADHLDASALAANPMGDINDVFAWMTSDGAKINLAMTVSPFDNGSRDFGPSVQYVIHLKRHAAFPATATLLAAGEEYRVICTFASNTSGQCWVVDPTNKPVGYVKGDFTNTAGKSSNDGKVKVFAGRRSDPFFFNFAGYVAARTMVEQACSGTTTPGTCPGVLSPAALNAAGCPLLPAANVAPVRAQLSTEQTTMIGPCPANQKDCFANANVMAIVVQIDKTLVVDDTKKLLGVWGSTHAAP